MSLIPQWHTGLMQKRGHDLKGHFDRQSHGSGLTTATIKVDLSISVQQRTGRGLSVWKKNETEQGPKRETKASAYAGFGQRLLANLIDGVLMSAWMIPALYYFYGDALLTNPHFMMGPADFIISWVLPMLGVLVLWDRKQGTVGKLFLGLRIVDADTWGPLSRKQELIRYLGYFLSTIPLGLGFLWIVFDPRKQGLHDRLAGTVVIRSSPKASRRNP